MDSKRVDAFDAEMELITPEDTGQLQELTIGVSWPQRQEDIRFLQSLGKGYILRDAISRPIGSGMYFQVGPDTCTIGMMITTPRLQAAGAGRWILQRLLDDSSAPGYLLNSTRRGLGLYLRDGFRPARAISQHQGIATTPPAVEPVPGLTVEPMTPAHLDEVTLFDTPAYGTDRGHVLRRLHDVGEGGMVALRGSTVAGYAMMRRFGRGFVIGPVVAETPEIAIAMIHPRIQAHRGEFLRMDIPSEDGPLNAFLQASGLPLFDKVIEMHKGRFRRAASPVMCALAAHAIG